MASDFSSEQKAALKRQVAERTKQEAAKAVAKQAAKLSGKAAAHAAKAEQLAAAADKVARHGDKLEHLAEHLDAIDVWLRRRDTRKPRLSQRDIATAALSIADAEGLEAVSMRRLAAELDVGTMTLYHYVRTKDELLALLTDEVVAEINLPAGERLPNTWQKAVRVIAHRSLAALRRHPWVLDLQDDPPFGPNGVRHFDQSLAAVSGFPGTITDRLDLLHAIDEFVFGFMLMERTHYGDTGEPPAALFEYLDSLLKSGEYPALGALVADHGLTGAWRVLSDHARDTERFDRQLERLIAGFEAHARR